MKTYVYLGIAILGAAIVAGCVGVLLYVYHVGVSIGTITERNIWQEQENTRLNETLELNRKIAAENAELISRVELQKRTITQKEHYITQWENKYATDIQKSNECNLTVATTQLHNCSTGMRSECSSEFIDSTGAASVVTGAAFIEHCNQLGIVSQRNAVQLQAIIEHLTREVK